MHKTGRYRECLLIGWAVWAIGLGLISTLSSESLGKQIGYGLLAGFGLGNTLHPSLIAVQAGVERKHMAVVTSFRNFIRNLGGTLGLAISGTIINNAIRSTLTPYGLSRPRYSYCSTRRTGFEHRQAISALKWFDWHLHRPIRMGLGSFLLWERR